MSIIAMFGAMSILEGITEMICGVISRIIRKRKMRIKRMRKKVFV